MCEPAREEEAGTLVQAAAKLWRAERRDEKDQGPDAPQARPQLGKMGTPTIQTMLSGNSDNGDYRVEIMQCMATLRRARTASCCESSTL